MDNQVWPEAGASGLSLTGGGTDEAVHDELAELFIGPSAGDVPAPKPTASRIGSPPQRSPATGRARIEALLLGHLPVRASLWVRQYAARLAERGDSAVGLVRLGREGANVERHQPNSENATNERGTTAGPFAWWVVRVDEVDQPSLVRACGGAGLEGSSLAGPGIDRITVLTGADDASVIACYRLLKSVAADLDRRLGDGEGPELAVAIAGADDERAGLAVQRLRDATQRFLGRELAEGPRVPRAGQTNAAVLGRWEGSTSVEELVETIRGGRLFWSDAATEAATKPEGDRVAVANEDVDAGEDADAGRGVRSGDRSNAAPSEPVDPIGLVGLIEGLVPVDIGCPGTSEVRFARDSDGRLHVLTRFGREGLDAAMAAAGWAKVNARLLCRVEPGIGADLGTIGCVVHVLGDDARELRALGDSDVRTHLLRSVATRQGDVWVCDPLN